MNKPSKTEDILFESMKNLGLKPDRQYPISKHHVDFAFPREKLIVEVDGWQYHKSREQREIDEKRRDIAENLGWRVKRFTAEEVYDNPELITWRIKELLGKAKNSNLKNFIEPKQKETPPQYITRTFNLRREKREREAEIETEIK